MILMELTPLPKNNASPAPISFKFVLQVAKHRLSICYLTKFLVDKDLRCEMADFSFGCQFYLIFCITNEYIIDVGIDQVCSCDILHEISQGILLLSCFVLLRQKFSFVLQFFAMAYFFSEV